MAQELTREELLAKAEQLYVEAAVMMTRLDKPMRRAVKMVLIDKRKAGEVALVVRRPRQNVYRALAAVRKQLEIVKAASAEPV